MRMRMAFVAVALALVAAGCGFHTISPPGAAQLRYRDAVFDPGEGHVPFNHYEEIVAQTTNFLYRMLDLPHAGV